MKKLERKALILIAFVLITAMMITFAGCSQPGKPDEASKGKDNAKASADEKEVRELVTDYMTAIQKNNFGTIIDMSGFIEKLPAESRGEMKSMITMALNGMVTEMGLKIDNFKIEKIEMDGGLAIVHVKETRSFKAMNGTGKDTATVDEKIVVLKINGKWKIDAMNTLNIAEIDLNAAQNPENISKLANSFGAGRIMALLADPQTAIIFGLAGPNFLRARAQGQFTQCQSNMKNIGTALEMYSTDHAGHYPKTLKEITPDYLKVIPTCASAAIDTYSASYEGNLSPDRYTFYCSGANHKAVRAPANFPQYNSTFGLIPRPR